MVQIPIELLVRYYMAIPSEDSTMEDSMKRYEGEHDFLNVFLQQTDYIPNKITEAQFLGEPVDSDYSEILQLRKQCRQRINELNALD